jgi:hypothetical protein
VAKHGWYSGSDRCIAAFLTDGSSYVLSFYHDGGEFLSYSAAQQDRASADLDDTYTDVSLTIPAFASRAQVTFRADADGDTTNGKLSWRTNGSSATNKIIAWVDSSASTDGGVEEVYTVSDVMTDSSQKIEIAFNQAGDHKAGVDTVGYYFPRGM